MRDMRRFLRVASLLAVPAAASVWPAPTSPASAAPVDNASAERIVFRSYTAIEQVDPDGSDRKVLIPDGNATEPDQTADASRLVYVETTSGRDAGQNLLVWHRLHVANGDGTGRAPLGGRDVFGTLPRWSPDGRRVVFNRKQPDGRDGPPQVAVVDADGANELVVAAGANADWSPDGRNLVFQANDRLWVAEARAGTRAVAITPPPSDTFRATSPAWSPDGSLIGFASGQCTYVVHPDGSGLRLVECTSKFAMPVGWSPGSRYLMYSGSGIHQDANLYWRTDDGVAHSVNQALGGSWTQASGPAGCERPYWLLGRDGGVFTFGGAGFYGSTGDMRLVQPVLGMAATPSGKGYWLVAGDGGVFTFGDAAFFGSTGAMTLKQPIVGMAPTASGKGYWLVAADGGVFTFGDARFHGSAGGLVLQQPVVGMVPTPGGGGYWLAARDGGVFTYGDATFAGSAASPGLGSPVVATAAGSGPDGLFLAAADGQVAALGAARFCGSAKPLALAAPIVGVAARR
jgi:hypothetical protein